MDKGFYRELVKTIIKLVLAGVLIGISHEYDLIIAIVLGLLIAAYFYKSFEKKDGINKIIVIGMITTGVLGVLIEYWGVSNKYWLYHNLSNGRSFPFWLPFAWMLAFLFLYMIEVKMIQFLIKKNWKNKFIMLLLVATVFPVLGEIITINLGVWTYFWPYQFLGIPFYAVLGLLSLHMFVNALLLFYCYKYKINDPIFSLEVS